jgi:RNA-directed DNA polymerase
MADASTSRSMSAELLKVVERAQREPEGRFPSRAHLIDEPALERAFHRLRKDAAVGVDGVTKEVYGRELDAHLADLHERLKAKRYRTSRCGGCTSRRTRAKRGRWVSVP